MDTFFAKYVLLLGVLASLPDYYLGEVQEHPDWVNQFHQRFPILAAPLIQQANRITTTTQRPKTPLEKFKGLVIHKIPADSYVQHFAKHDSYLMRWLEAKRMDVRAAQRMFLNHLKWRKNERIDTILEEEWPVSFQREYTVDTNGVDRLGRPVAQVALSQMDIQQIVDTESVGSLLRWSVRLFELQSRQLYETLDQGRSINGTVLLLGLDNVDLKTIACPNCLRFYAKVVALYEDHYPGLWGSAIAIDTPRSFQIIWRIVQPMFRWRTRASIKVLKEGDYNWDTVLDAIIDKDQRSIFFGGNARQ